MENQYFDKKVYLIGAGPGDAGLMTVKGRELLAAADTVIYDALAGDGIMGFIHCPAGSSTRRPSSAGRRPAPTSW